jgi:small subunit ribosomal protein S27Ae
MANKKPNPPKKSIKVHSFFAKEGDGLKRTKKSCPKCGTGYFMAAHKSRSTCGKCKYTEFTKKEVKPEVKKE